MFNVKVCTKNLMNNLRCPSVEKKIFMLAFQWYWNRVKRPYKYSNTSRPRKAGGRVCMPSQLSFVNEVLYQKDIIANIPTSTPIAGGSMST